MSVLSVDEITAVVKSLLRKYQAEYAILFGSYARGEATNKSDIDLLVFGGDKFIPRDIFALAEELREICSREADVFEIREVNRDTAFYESVLRDGIRIA